MHLEMINKTRSWFKTKSLYAKIGISAAAMVLISTPVFVAAMSAQNNPDQHQSVVNESTAKETENTSNDQEEVTINESSPVVNETETNDETQSESTGEGSQSQSTPQTEPPVPTYTDTYPWTGSCGGIDTWGLTKCQSTSYTAWKVNEKYGSMLPWGMTSPNGDAKNWPTHADNSSIPRGTTPKKYSVAVKFNQPSGLTAWVEAVDGNKITVSLYNWGSNQAYKLLENVDASYFDTYIYFN
jgi:surface antigen